MTLIIYKTIAALIIFLISLAAVIYPLKIRSIANRPQSESLELGEALASGIFLGVAFFHMLPSAITFFHQAYPEISYPVPEVICAAGFLLMLFLERLSFANSFFNPKHAIPYILAIILIIHSLTEGAALGVGSNLTDAAMIFIAIVAHKGSASFALCVTLIRHHLPLSRIITIILLFSLMTPLGIGLGISLHVLTQSGRGEIATAVFNAFAAGTFLYISTLHHIRFHQRREEAHGLLEFSFLALGLVSMGVIAFWA